MNTNYTKNHFLRAVIILFLHIIFTTGFMLQAQTSNPVGAIPGVIDVSPMGAATYTIPIEVVPGTMGMQPNLSIVYNSFGGMGLLGMKWGLAGLSAITRCGQTLYYDDSITATQFNSSDRLAIDGERLLRLNNGNYLDTDGEYATEIENFTRIVSYSGQAGSPSWFKAYTDDGSIIDYGLGNNSYHRVGGKGSVLAWQISKITDANGNYMTFHYKEEQGDGESLIDSIKYISNNAKVVFDYRDLPDSLGRNTYFVAGGYIKQSKLLNAITVYYDNTIVRKYQFNYNLNDSGEQTAHLKEVILSEYDENGGIKQLNPTTIRWGAQNNNIVESTIDAEIWDIITGDFNGDGYMDYVVYNREHGTNKTFQLYLNDPNNNTFYSTGLPSGTSLKSRAHSCDFYGNGKDVLVLTEEVVRLVSINLGIYDTTYRINVCSYENNIWNKQIILDSIRYFHRAYFGDFTGNGKVNIMYEIRQKDGKKWKHTLRFSNNGDLSSTALTFYDIDDIRIVDYNGDGKADIQITIGGNTDIYSYSATDNKFNKVFGTGFPTKWHHFFHGDFNGDGITDIITFSKEDGIWRLYFGLGNGAYIWPGDTLNFLNNSVVYNGDNIEIEYPLFIADINGDGKDDIIQPHYIGSDAYHGQTILNVYYSSGCINGYYANGCVNGKSKFISAAPKIIDGNYCSKSFPYLHHNLMSPNQANFVFWYLGDFNGDGQNDLLLRRNVQDTQPKIITFNKNEQYEFVAEFTDGMGKKIELNYNHKYFKAPQKKFFLPVVASLKIPNGIGGQNTLSYNYLNPEYSSKRRTFLGFKEFTCYNSQEKKKISNLFWYDDWYTYAILVPLEQTIRVNNKIISKTEYKSLPKELNNKRLTTDYNIIREFDSLAKTVTITCNYLSDAGRLVKTWKRTGEFSISGSYWNPPPTWPYADSTTYEYKPLSLSTTNTYHKKTVPKKTITTQIYRNPNNQYVAITDTLTYDYYLRGADNGRLNWKRQGNADGSITTTYSDYTPTGLYQEKTVSAAGCDPRKEYYVYDNANRLLTTVKNHLLHETQFTYNPRTGNKTKEIGPNGLTTTYSYDAFGNLTQINYPDGTQTNISVDWYTGRDLPNAHYYTTTTSTGKSDLIVYYDILGRKVCRLADDYYLETHYNDKGQVEKTSHLFQNFRHPDRYKAWHEYTYDDLGRKIKETAPYTHLLYEYDERKVTVTDSLRNVSSSKTFDALERITKAEDEGGTIIYDYAVITDGNKKRHQTTITTNGATTYIKSDLWGNRLSIKEPNAGLITSEYNNFNELVEQTDARGNVTTYQYDKLGRVTQKHFIGSSPINFVYDDANHGVGKLHKVSQGLQTQEAFSYDALGRVATHTKSIDANTTLCKHSYTYNANGQLHTLTYPSGFGVTYSYTETGKLNEIRRSDNDDLIYKVTSRNKYQQPTKCWYGNDAATYYTYDTHGLLTRINTGNMITIGIIDPGDTAIIDPGGGADLSGSTIGIIGVDSAILNYRYAYDERGLMISRSESVLKRLETYEYDELDRLTKITSGAIGQTGTPQTFSYYNNGNFNNHSALGTYSYTFQTPGSNVIKAHAVSEIIPADNNVISGSECSVIYNSFNQPTKITEDNHWLDLTYDVNQQRHKTERYKNGNKEMTRYHVHKGYEIDRDPGGYHKKHYHYIYGDNGVVALYIGNLIIEQDTTTGGGIILPKSISFTTDSMYYIHTDHLGSYCAITNANKEVKQRNYFDPWGNFRLIYRTRNGFSMEDAEMPTDSLGMETIASMNFKLTDRGFTGHEHYPYFKIINMNGRLYDPVIARFFSPDKFVANSTFTQDFNRYTYARNNPLMYTDPDGQFIQYIFGALMGGFSGYQIGKAAGAKGWAMFGYIMGGAGIGALTAGIGTAISTTIGTSMTAAGASCAGWVGAMAGSTVSGAISGAAFTGLAGGNPLDGLWKGALTGLAGSSIGPLIGGAPGAIVSGVMSGAVSSALHGGSWKDVGISALLGGGVAWGSYEISQAIGYGAYKKAYNGLENKPGDMWNYRQYRAASVAAQRSFARGVEGGGWIRSKKMGMWPYGTDRSIEATDRPNDPKGFFHTHPNKGANWTPGHGTDDFIINNTHRDFGLPSYVIGRNDVYFQAPFTTDSHLLFPSAPFNPYPYYYYPFLHLNLWGR